jgi:3-hydroxyisobutyrate dehydrogenase-like beta-hydroxyacid dehydrogenase
LDLSVWATWDNPWQPIYQNYGQKLVEGSYDKAGFKLSLGMKDIDLVLQTAKASRCRCPWPVFCMIVCWLALGVADDAGLS